MKMTGSFLRQLFFILFISLAAGVFPAQADSEMRAVRLPAQKLSQSLLDLSEQFDAALITDSALVNGLDAPAISGIMTIEEAMGRLLAPLSLSFETTERAAFRIVSCPKCAARPKKAAPPAIPVEMPEKDVIIVTGTNIRTMSNIRGAPTDSAPVFTYGRDVLDESGHAAAAEFIQVQPASYGDQQNDFFAFDSVTIFDTSGLPVSDEIVFRESLLDDNGVTIHGLRPLTLVDSRRLFGGLSSLPVTAIERVEVLTDGASAIYGDGAVPGVVNVILRDEFDGVETTGRYGFVNDSGAEEYLAAMTAGKVWDSGKIILTYEYLKRTDLTFFDRPFRPRGQDYCSAFPECPSFFEGPTFVSLAPGEKHHKFYGAINQNMSEGVALFAEVIGDIEDRIGTFDTGLNLSQTSGTEFESIIRETNISAVVGLRADLSGDWLAEISALRSAKKGAATLWSVAGKADGSLTELPGGDLKLAVGGEFRIESTDGSERNIAAGYGEAFIPLIGKSNRRPGLERLELSLAGRFDHYRGSGGVFSPRGSVLWAPFEGLTLRGAYGRSFYAPTMTTTDDFAIARLSGTPVICITSPCPSPANILPVINVASGMVDIPPSLSDNWTFGGDLTPPFAPDLKLSASYYNIRIKGQPFTPLFGMGADFPSIFPDTHSFTLTPEFIERITPIVERVAQERDFPFSDCIQSVSSVENIEGVPVFETPNGQCIRLSDVIASGEFGVIDQSVQTTAEIRTKGLNAALSYDVDTDFGEFNIFANANYIFTFKKKLTEQTGFFEQADSFANPLDLRLRGGASWAFDGFSAAVIVNYTDGYRYRLLNGRIAAPSFVSNDEITIVPVASMTTLDLHLAYDTGETTGSRWLNNIEASISVINATDELPQAIDGSQFGFDDYNASPLGRFIAFQVTKKW